MRARWTSPASKRVANSQAGIEALLARAGKAVAQVRWAVDLITGWPPTPVSVRRAPTSRFRRLEGYQRGDGLERD
jgi:hypothetical protein